MKILYGVPGEGMGHATRGKVILEHLTKHHDVRIVSSDRAFKFLHAIYPDQTHEIKGFHFAFKDGEVSVSRTAVLNLKTAPENLITNFKKYREIHDSFSPDLVISDFESFAFFYAKYHNLPIISIDNMQILDRATIGIDIPEEEKNNFNIAKAVVKAKLPGCNKYLISAFFDIELRKENTVLVPPIIRNEILQAKTEIQDHILVYQSSYGENGILELLKQIPDQKFYLYGFNKEEDHGNVQMKKFSEAEFINYFRTAKAVFANGGYSFISEAIYLKKPICSVPIKNQFEQYFNGAYIQKMGYGKLLTEFNLDGIKAFLYDLPKYRETINGYSQDGNTKLFQEIDKAIEEVMG